MLDHRSPPPTQPDDARPLAGLVRTHWMLAVCVLTGRRIAILLAQKPKPIDSRRKALGSPRGLSCGENDSAHALQFATVC